MLIDGTTTGLTPLPYQYSGRHISNWKLLVVVVEKLAPGVTGKIQVGVEPGASAQVTVPACGVPLAGGTEPNAPDAVDTDPLGAALLQAARPSGRDNAAHRQGRRPARDVLLLSPNVLSGCGPAYRAPVVCSGLCAVESSRPPSVVNHVVHRTRSVAYTLTGGLA